jgi:hypothetical protein
MRSGIVSSPSSWVVFLLLPILCLSVGEAGAIGLGKMTVLSRLGSPFEAEVQLLDTTPGKHPVTECFRLGRTGEGDVPILTRARLTVEQRGGGLRLRIVSSEAINEPVLQVSLRAGCDAEVVRNYLLLIDPPTTRAPQRSLEPPVAQGVSAEESASGRVPPPRSLYGIPDGPHGLPPGGIIATVRSGPEAARLPGSRPARQAVRSAARPDNVSDRLFLSSSADREESGPGFDRPLRLSTRLSMHLLSKTSESQRSMLRIEYKLLSALHTQAEQQLAVAEQIRRLERTLNELHHEMEVQAPPEEQGRPTTASEGQAVAAAPAGRPAASAGRTPSQMAAATAFGTSDEPDWWLEAGLLLGVTAGLTWLLRRRSGKNSGQTEIPAPVPPAVDSSNDDAWEPPTFRNVARRAAVTEIEPVAETLYFPNEPVSESAQIPGSSEVDEVAAVLELAELMLSFGRVRGAEQALEEFIDHKPAAAVTPWLELLQIYRQNGQREAFEALAVKLTRNFNVAPPAWEEVAELADPVISNSEKQMASIEQLLARLPGIGELTHIRDEVSRTWASPECLAYLNKLLRDNRNGQRKGFALGTVRELLLLIDLKESNSATRQI